MDTVGPMTRTVEDAALLMGAIAGYDPKDPLTAQLPVPDYRKPLPGDLGGVRVGLVREFMDQAHVDPEVLQGVTAAVAQIKDMGATVQDVSLPLLAETGPLMTVIAGSDGAFVVREWLRTRPEDFGPSLRRRWLAASLIPAQALKKAERMRAILRREWLKLFEQFDVLLSPTHPVPAEKIQYEDSVTTREEAERRFAGRRYFTEAPALAGTPAMSVPCGYTSDGLPIGLQIMTAHFQEATMFKVGFVYEQKTQWYAKGIAAQNEKDITI
jgi:aspartyl-tRNA(Asn)/glutamyl-tRNA(Gln) amidotransferase subunit A